MNGRIYDPLLGRFLGADIVVQAPMSLQSYNRYSYMMNNPLTLVDPSGFIFGTPLSTREYFGSVLSGLGQGGVEVASSFRRSAEGIGTMAGHLSVDPIGTVTAAHDQLTTNLANGYELAASTTASDVSRDLSNAGSMYANNENGFRDEVSDMTTGTAITLAAGEALKPIEAAVKAKVGDLLNRLDNVAPETRAAPEVQEQAPLQRQPEQQQAQAATVKEAPTATRRQAFNEAKEANGIPKSQQPDVTIKPGTPEGKATGLDNRNVRQYEFTNSEGKKITIREDKPATYPEGGKGDQKRHFNSGSSGSKLKDHHYFED